MSDRVLHFLHNTIEAFTKEFQVHHQKRMPYHPQANDMVEDLIFFLEKDITKVCNVNINNYDLRIPIVLWAYRTTYKKLLGQTPFLLVYG